MIGKNKVLQMKWVIMTDTTTIRDYENLFVFRIKFCTAIVRVVFS